MFTPDAAIGLLLTSGILFIIINYFLKKWQKSDTINSPELFKIFISSLLIYLLIMKVNGLLLAYFFDTIERNFNKKTFFISLFTDFLNGVVYGSFFLTYYYFNKSKKYLSQIANYHHALSESRIHQLKSQMNPHFLFNNLNILDQLIEEDKIKASEFLNEFSEIYRYVLDATDKSITTIKDELIFAKQYFKLVQTKYESSYQLKIENEIENGYVVPLTLQLFIENAIKHNIGTKEKPIIINIKFNNCVYISNNTNLKKGNSKSGRTIKNLQEQYKLLAGKSIKLKQTDNIFSVKIPIINKPLANESSNNRR